MKKRTERLFFGIVIGLILMEAGFLKAARAQDEFDYNFIISDKDLTDYQALDQAGIQSFLASRQSALARYVEPITSMRASQIIYLSAQEFQINPKFLIALIQKEQSLIEDPSPQPSQFDWATGYAVCDDCRTDDPALQKFKGFFNQVYNAAKRIRTVYLRELQESGMTSSGYGPGLVKLVDGLAVVPANFATAALYTYTPHLHGNRLLKEIWLRYFSQTYPDGALLRAEADKDIWLIEDGYRRRFANESVYLSRYADFKAIVTVSRIDLEKYPVGKEIVFANYSYLRTPRGTVYLIVDDKLRGFASGEALRRVGVNPEEIIDVAEDALAGYREITPITIDSLYPLGALLQDKSTGGVYWVQDGVKHVIPAKEIMLVNFPNRKIIVRTPQELATLATGEPVLFRDGLLVKSEDDPAVYIISHGLRRPIVSADDFLSLGFAWHNVIQTSSRALALHPLGDPLSVNF